MTSDAQKLLNGLAVLNVYDETGDVHVAFEILYAGPQGPNAVSPAHQEMLRGWGWEYHQGVQCWAWRS